MQDHFVEILDKYIELAALNQVSKIDDNGIPQLLETGNSGCSQLIDKVNMEIKTEHGLVRNPNTGNPAVARNSRHPSGLAVDFSRAILDMLAVDRVRELANNRRLVWFYPADKVHFEYQGAVNNQSFETGSLLGWSVEGEGTANVVENPAIPGDFFAELTAGSPISLSQVVDVPHSEPALSFEVQFPSGTGSLSVFLDSQLLAELTSGAYTDPVLSRVSLEIPPSLEGLVGAELTFEFDGPTGSRAFLDNVDIFVIPEPSTLTLLTMATLALLAYAWRRRRGR